MAKKKLTKKEENQFFDIYESIVGDERLDMVGENE